MTVANRQVNRRWALPTYLAGQGISLLGDQAYYVALTWAATVQGGAAGVALVASIAAVPRALLMLPGGVIASHFGIRRVMIASDTVRMVIVALAGALLLSGAGIWALAGTALVFGIADSLYLPSSSALPPRLVPPENLQRANSLITFIRRVAMLAGAPLGGLLVAGPGPGVAFVFEAGTFAVSVLCLSVLPLLPLPPGTRPRPRRQTLMSVLAEGPRDIWRSPLMRGLVLVGAITELGFTGPYNAGLPLLAHYRGWGAEGMGLVLSAFGLGAAIGALAAARVRKRVRPGWVVIIAGAAQAAALGGLALTPALGGALPLSFVIGVAASLYGTTLMTMVQLSADPGNLVQMMSVVSLSSYGTVPVSNSVTAVTAVLASVPGAYLLGAFIEFVAAGVALAVRPVRTMSFPAPEPEPKSGEDRRDGDSLLTG
ncbi:MAG: MFS transporter [Streptosporangiaceae bacterium]